jgi:outer membrane lipoprotein SlyB
MKHASTGGLIMNNSISRTNPLIVVAAVAVILTCLVALGVLTGIIPSPMNRGVEKEELTSTAPTDANKFAPSAPAAPRGTASSTTTTRETRTVTRAPAAEPRPRVADRAPAPAAAAGATSGSSASQSVAGSSPAPAACMNCGTVTSVNAVKQQGEAGMIGPAAGALLGGVLGNQIGGGSGKTIATVVGAGAGAAAGTEAERRYKSTTGYVVNVRLNDGTTRSFNYASDPGVQAGSKVRVVDGRLLHN